MSEKTSSSSGESAKTSEENQVMKRFWDIYKNYQRLSEKTQRIKRFEAMFDLLTAHDFLEERAKRNLIPMINLESTSANVGFEILRAYLRPKVIRVITDISYWFRQVSSKELESNDFTLEENGIDFEICIIDASFKTYLETTARFTECPEYQKAPQAIKDIVQRLAELGFDHQKIELSGQARLYSINAFTIITTIENVALLEGIKMDIWKREARDHRQN
jgi:hypothetical protein